MLKGKSNLGFFHKLQPCKIKNKMTALKKIFKWMLITVLAFYTFNLFISADYQVERSIEINVPSYVVYAEVTDLQSWPNWAIWWKQDSTLVTEYTGERYGNNSRMSWDGKEAGKGTLEIIAVSFADSINTELIFDGMDPAYGYRRFTETDGTTKVVWGMKGEMPFFVRFITLFFDAMVGKDFEEGLKGLKERCESFPI